MIVAERKPMEEIRGFVKGARKALLVGCRGCVTVCNSGGTKEVEILASLLRLGARSEGEELAVDEFTIERQCDPEYVEGLSHLMDGRYDRVLSMGCSIGGQYISRRYPMEAVYPVLNTCFMGGATAHGVWAEHCQACGDCVIHLYGGICPISRCSKSLLNGPCGGSSDGRCEVSKEIDCVWQLIVEKMALAGRTEELLKTGPAKDWRTSRDGGPRKSVREELLK
jgi:ferredoxin